jgi:hypothetical protein
MKINQPVQGVTEDSLSERGMLMEDGGDPGSLRVVEFGGLFVPEDGLVVSPPFGGELAVWPDGSYAFTASLAEGEGVATHYSYVVETTDGSSFMGSFSLGEEAILPEAMQDFQAWSLPEFMDGAVASLLNGAAPGLMEYFAPDASDHAGHSESMTLAEHGSEFDDLTRLILDSQNS